MSDRELLRRTAARVLVVDAADRLLLLRGVDPAVPDRPFWFTVGGGLEPGESPRAGAVRELHEETGIVVAEEALVGPVYGDESGFAFDRWWIEQSNDFFAVRVRDTRVLPAGLESTEVASILASAWWTLPELRAHAGGRPNEGPGLPGEAVYPERLADVLETALVALRDVPHHGLA